MPKERKTQLFDTRALGVEITPERLRAEYDGTTFNGANALRVEFDENGEIVRVRSFNLNKKEAESVPFVRGKTGGWRGEGGFYGDSTVLGEKLNAVVKTTKEDWQLWQEKGGENSGLSFREWKKEYVNATANEAKRLQDELGQDETAG